MGHAKELAMAVRQKNIVLQVHQVSPLLWSLDGMREKHCN